MKMLGLSSLPGSSQLSDEGLMRSRFRANNSFGSLIVGFMLALAGCEGALDRRAPKLDAAAPINEDGGVDAAGGDATDASLLPTLPARAGCRPGPGISGTPASIDDAVKLINSLARPVTVACFLESLDRPLRVTATNSILSLQPASGNRSPRTFLITDKLIMSVVFDGIGQHLIEFGQFVTPTRTLKAEIAFPIETELLPGLPFQRIHSDVPDGGDSGMGTSCRFCHYDEQPAPQITDAIAYTSVAFKPDWRTKVPLDSLVHERLTCDAATEPVRCEMLHAFFDHGEVTEVDFPDDVTTIFN